MKTTSKRVVSFLFFFIFLLSWMLSAGGIATARADASAHTNVLDDLRKDETFKASEFKRNDNDYTLQVIQIAESTGKELFIYVFNPSFEVTPLTATSISLATETGENYSPNKYRLSLINKANGFQKYIVRDFKVKADTVRYYDIPMIMRAWNKDIDKAPVEGEINEVGINVAQRWGATNVDGQVKYYCAKSEVIEITGLVPGLIRYQDGYPELQFSDFTECHYVAFNTDKKIDELYEADVNFVKRDKVSYWTVINGLLHEDEGSVEYGDSVSKKVTITGEQVVEKEPSNLLYDFFHKKWSWTRIQTVQEFITTERLTDEAREDLKGMQWVLRFYESDYTIFNHSLGYVINGEEVSEITILRLKFETAGKVYNLGVVTNSVTGNGIPDNILFPPSAGDRILAWVIFIGAIILGLLIVKYSVKLLISIASGNMHLIIKIIGSIIVLSVVVIYGVVLIKMIVPLIVNLGCLGVDAIDKVLYKMLKLR